MTEKLFLRTQDNYVLEILLFNIAFYILKLFFHLLKHQLCHLYLEGVLIE